MKPLLLLLLCLPLVLGCSQSKLLRLMTKSPRLETDWRSAEENKYQQDARYLAGVIREAYPKLEEKMPPARFEAETQHLIRACGTLDNDEDFAAELQRFMARLKDGHSRISSLTFYRKGAPRYSLAFFREGDRFLIANIDRTADSALIGNQVLAVNGLSIDSVQKRILDFESAENKFFAYHRFQGKEVYPRYWKILGVLPPHTDSLTLTIRNTQGVPVTVCLTPKTQTHFYRVVNKPVGYAFTRQQNDGFFYKILEKEKIAYLQMNTCLDFVAVKSEIHNYTNFITRPIALSFMKKRTRHARNFGLVLQRMFTEMHQKGISTLVLDLRYNTGGDERLGKQLLWYLTRRTDIQGFRDYYRLSTYMKQQVKRDYRTYARLFEQRYGRALPSDTLLPVTEKLLGSPTYFQDIEKPGSPFLLDRQLPKFGGQVYIITGPRTFSAAQVLATTFQDNGLGLIVGTPTGNKPSTQTGASLFKLPHTKLICSISYLYMERPDARKHADDALYPDIPVEKTLFSVRNGRDEAFEWIVRQTSAHQN